MPQGRQVQGWRVPQYRFHEDGLIAHWWNLALEQRRFAYHQRRVTLRSYDQNAHLTQARAELPWLADLPAQSAQQVFRHLDRAYDNWWNPEHPAQAPEFKKRSARLTVPFPGQAITVQRLNRRRARVRLPKIGRVRFRWSRAAGQVRNATVTVDGSGTWHISFGVHTGAASAPPNGLPSCGVDFGVAAPRTSPMSPAAGQAGASPAGPPGRRVA